ncbi:MAG: MazG family protein [Rhodococcus sp.]|nr:MazG family protein [Rhodococcus sp. (in: high G+C Gram-positive bacteria)]
MTDPQQPGRPLAEAVDIMDRLWSYSGWEVTQTHRSLAHYLVEETYEVLDAIEADQPQHLCEELGDLLLQVLFHSRIAQAAGQFDVDDVAAGLVAKLRHRSPHLGTELDGPIDVAEQERAWEERKALEKARRSVVDGVAMSQPATSLAEKIVHRARTAGVPAELVPESLATLSAQVAAAQNALRGEIDAFARRLQTAEAHARAEGVEVLSDEDWRRYLA